MKKITVFIILMLLIPTISVVAKDLKLSSIDNVYTPITDNSPPEITYLAYEDGYILVSAHDPDGDDVFYQFGISDGTKTRWQGSYKSDEIAHIQIKKFKEPGIYELRARARDVNGATGIWTNPITIVIGQPHIEIDRIWTENGELFVQIQNTGDLIVTDIEWEIRLDKRFDNYNSGIIDVIHPGEYEIISMKYFGFGMSTLKITVGDTYAESKCIVMFKNLIIFGW